MDPVYDECTICCTEGLLVFLGDCPCKQAYICDECCRQMYLRYLAGDDEHLTCPYCRTVFSQSIFEGHPSVPSVPFEEGRPSTPFLDVTSYLTTDDITVSPDTPVETSQDTSVPRNRRRIRSTRSDGTEPPSKRRLIF
jgi:hypothetical protein